MESLILFTGTVLNMIAGTCVVVSYTKDEPKEIVKWLTMGLGLFIMAMFGVIRVLEIIE